jgi:hypothetical protein
MNLSEREKLIRSLPEGDFTRISIKKAEEVGEEWEDASSTSQQTYVYNKKTPAEIVEYLNNKKLTMTFGYALQRLLINKYNLPDNSPVDEIAEILHKAFHDGNIPVLDRNGRKPSKNDELKQIKAWLVRENADRSIFLRKISFAIGLSDIQVSHFLRKELGEQDFNIRNAEEIILFYCLYHGSDYSRYIELLKEYNSLIPDHVNAEVKADYTALFLNNYNEYFSDDAALLGYLLENSGEFINVRQSTIEQFRYLWYKAIKKTNELLMMTENAEPIREDEFYHTLCAHLPQYQKNNATVYTPKGSSIDSLVSLPLNRQRISRLLGKTDESTNRYIYGSAKETANKKDLVTMEFYIFCINREINLRKNIAIDYYADYNRFISETDDMLFENGFYKLYPGNRFDNLVMISLMNTDCWGFWETILEASFGFDYDSDSYIEE